MRCKCCDTETDRRFKNDFYCLECFEVIKKTYKEMRERDYNYSPSLFVEYRDD